MSDIKLFWSQDDKSWVAQWSNFTGFGDTTEEAYKELCEVLALALENEIEERMRKERNERNERSQYYN